MASPTTTAMRRLPFKLIYLRRRFRRESQGKVAGALGLSQAALSHLEQGRTKPSLPVLMAICRYYGVSPEYLLYDERPIEPDLFEDGWAEVNLDTAVPTRHGGGWVLFALAGARVWRSTAQAERSLCKDLQEAEALEKRVREAEQAVDRQLEEDLSAEMVAARKPRGSPPPDEPAQALVPITPEDAVLSTIAGMLGESGLLDLSAEDAIVDPDAHQAYWRPAPENLAGVYIAPDTLHRADEEREQREGTEHVREIDRAQAAQELADMQHLCRLSSIDALGQPKRGSGPGQQARWLIFDAKTLLEALERAGRATANIRDLLGRCVPLRGPAR